jgi:hypothetical protein
MGNEMAHYARDCWDAECLTSYVSLLYIMQHFFTKLGDTCIKCMLENVENVVFLHLIRAGLNVLAVLTGQRTI